MRLANMPNPHSSLDRRVSQRPVGLSSVFSTILLAEAILAVLPVGVETVVDVGGGEAPYASWASARLHVTVDWRAPEMTLASHQVVGDACQLPIASHVADLVLCTEVVEHVPDDGALYAELRRIVRNDGSLILTAPFVHALHESPHDYRRPTSAGLLHGLTAAAFQVQRMSAVGGTRDVVIDLGIRSTGQRVRAVARRVPRPVAVRTEKLFGRLQSLLANQSLQKTGGRLATIDPLQATPRLSLGYVVTARPV